MKNKFKIEKVTHDVNTYSYRLSELVSKSWFGTTWRIIADFDTLGQAEAGMRKRVNYPYTSHIAYYNSEGYEEVVGI